MINLVRSLLAGLAVLGFASSAYATTATSVGVSTVSCSSSTISVGWTGAPTTQWQAGRLWDGATQIGGFNDSSPRTGMQVDYNSGYGMAQSTTVPAQTVVTAYATVSATNNPAATDVEYVVVYNCTTAAIQYSCYGPFGSCTYPQRAPIFPGQGAESVPVPSLSEWAMMILIGLMAIFGVAAARRRSQS
jgi:hypothetical protein